MISILDKKQLKQTVMNSIETKSNNTKQRSKYKSLRRNNSSPTRTVLVKPYSQIS